MFGLALTLNSFSAVSLPYTPAPYTFVAEIEFNENTFNGSVNGQDVFSLQRLRVRFACFVKTMSNLVNFLPHPSSWVTGKDTLPLQWVTL